jgi:Mrp family chromosome partitioning ATPase
MTTTIATPRATTNGQAGRQSPFAEECLALLDRLEIDRSQPTTVTRALGMLSCLPGEGVSTIIAETGIAAASYLDLRTVIVDCHLARPSLHRLFNVGLCPGLKDALIDDVPLDNVVRPSGIETLSIITAGTVRNESGPIWLSPNLPRLVDDLRSEFDLVLFDLPPLNQGRPIRLGTLLDGVLLVVEAEKVQWEVAQRATASLHAGGVNLLGAVMNKRRQYLPGWLGQSVAH